MKAIPKDIPESISLAHLGPFNKTYVVYVGRSYEDAAGYWTGDSWSTDEEEAMLYEVEIDAHRVARRVGGKVD